MELETKQSKNRINTCGNNVPFNKIYSGEESNFIIYKKLTKEPTIHYQIVSGAHRVLDELNSTDIWR